LDQHDMSYEVMNTFNAIATFNILNGEERRVAAAIIPSDT